MIKRKVKLSGLFKEEGCLCVEFREENTNLHFWKAFRKAEKDLFNQLLRHIGYYNSDEPLKEKFSEQDLKVITRLNLSPIYCKTYRWEIDEFLFDEQAQEQETALPYFVWTEEDEKGILEFERFRERGA